MRIALYGIILLLLPVLSRAQVVEPITGPEEEEVDSTRRVKILHSDFLSYIKEGEEGIQKLIGDVQLQQDSTYFYCDSAYFYENSNRLEAFDNVQVDMPDSVTMICDRLDYDATERIAEAYDNVEFTDQNSILYTDHLTFYRNENYGVYPDSGRLVDDDNVLTSLTGYYYPDIDMAYFKKNVKLVSPDYILETDTLGYNTETGVATFLAPTVITNSDGIIYTSNGNYDTEAKKVNLFDRSTVKDTTYSLAGDTLYYDDERNLGIALGNVLIRQEDSTLEIRGQYGEFKRDRDESMVTDDPVAIQFLDDDTLYVFADTLFTFMDTTIVGADTLAKRIFRAYKDVRFFMNDIQGRADSMVYLFDDSLMYLYQKPVLWSNINQLTGDTIVIQMRNSQADSMWVGRNGFLVSEEDTIGFNQIKGKELQAKFRDNQLVRLHVIGNSESIYFTKNEEDDYEGMNKSLSQEMIIFLKDNEAKKIVFIASPTGEFFPLHEVIFKENKLEGMPWRITEKPIKPKLEFETVPPSVPQTPDELLDPVERGRIEEVLKVESVFPTGEE